MKTILIQNNIEDAAEILRQGGLVAVPTETVYGLSGNGLDPTVIEKIYEIKGRPAVKPISLMVAGAEAIQKLCINLPDAAKTLAERFWPGPLTLVAESRPEIPEILRAGGKTVGLRCPRQDQTLSLLRLLDFPLAVPSANPSGKASPKRSAEVLDYFDGRIEAVIDGGDCDLGLESTILDLTSKPYRILRQGALPAEQIENALIEGMQIIGITGGSGCGKTTALSVLEEHGALVLDCDRVYHQLLEENDELNRELSEVFPEASVGGKICRPRLARVVFHDSGALQTLNNITHQYITDEIRNRLRDHAMNGGTLAALDAIELINSGLAKMCTWVLGVTASEEVRTVRIMQRDGISREAALERIRAQRTNEFFEKNCDVTVSNNGSPEAFRNEVKKVLEEKLWKKTRT